MTEPADRRDAELTDGWPDQPDNAELADLARRLRDGRPELPPAQLARAQAAMRREMDGAQARPVRRIWPWGLAAAAAVLLAVGVYEGQQFFASRPPPGPTAQVPPVSTPLATDSYTVRISLPPAGLPGRALLPLEEYQSLYTDLHLTQR